MGEERERRMEMVGEEESLAVVVRNWAVSCGCAARDARWLTRGVCSAAAFVGHVASESHRGGLADGGAEARGLGGVVLSGGWEEDDDDDEFV